MSEQNTKYKEKKYINLSEEEISKIAKEMGKNVGNYIDNTQEHLYQAKDKCEEAIRTHPLASAGLALELV